MNLYRVTTAALVAVVVACGAAGSDPTTSARADNAGAGSPGDCACASQPGPQGAPGPQGPQGPAGKDAVCAAGMGQCPQGVAGPAGNEGAKGADGSSCSATGGGDTVQVACTNGTMATLTARSGPKGDKGDKGDTGAQGLQGLPGEKGAPGQDGAAGLAITKSALYARTGQLSSGTAYAYCDDENDVLITGGCSGSAPVVVNGPFQATSPNAKAYWQCTRWGTASPGEVFTATAVCLGVP